MDLDLRFILVSVKKLQHLQRPGGRCGEWENSTSSLMADFVLPEGDEEPQGFDAMPEPDMAGSSDSLK